jgi:hypothetical protein
MIKNYKNRKQMLKEFGVTDMDIMDAVTDTNIIYSDHRLTFDYETLETVATSAGTYGVNGAVIKATRKGYNVPTYFGIKGRTSLLFKVVA